ncbi:MAG: hypothetical protein Q8O03_09135, partial [Nanoarchaeota archaeon]|nr:hypothetical protein [Nanoarchaeota archaeon]
MRKNKRLTEIANPLQFIGVPRGFPSMILRTSSPLLSRSRHNVCVIYVKKGSDFCYPFFSGVPKGI